MSIKHFFRDAKKVSVASLIATIVVFVALQGLFWLPEYDIELLHMFANVFIAVALPFLIVVPVAGFIYSFFIKGSIKFLFIILHFICICTISGISFMGFMFRYFVPFAP